MRRLLQNTFYGQREIERVKPLLWSGFYIFISIIFHFIHHIPESKISVSEWTKQQHSRSNRGSWRWRKANEQNGAENKNLFLQLKGKNKHFFKDVKQPKKKKDIYICINPYLLYFSWPKSKYRTKKKKTKITKKNVSNVKTNNTFVYWQRIKESSRWKRKIFSFDFIMFAFLLILNFKRKRIFHTKTEWNETLVPYILWNWGYTSNLKYFEFTWKMVKSREYIPVPNAVSLFTLHSPRCTYD